MKILVIGSGGREHALTWKLAKSDLVSEIVCAPGNPGIQRHAELANVSAEDVDGLATLAGKIAADLVVVGPEVPLVDGLADELANRGIPTFGPRSSAARLEGSKSWANDLMYRHNIPCPKSRTFDDASPAIHHVESLPQGSVVVKADGLAAGKGVIIPETQEDAISAISAALDQRAFGDAGETIVIQERLTGPELSVFAFVDGETVSNLVAARDYKRAYDDDVGANTGGMGAFTSPYLCPPSDLDQIRTTIIEPTARALVAADSPYQGVLYAGLMLTDSGPQVIEFNCRFGDPECEPLMLRLDSDLAEVCLAVAESRLDSTPVIWNDKCAVGVVVVSSTYPVSYETGFPITGELPNKEDAIVFHAGTAEHDDGELVTAGGRVLVATASSNESLVDARRSAYRIAEGIEFTGARYRSDIAAGAV
jgi:phosphoribosylamine--glycine ligase